jgi:predicted unusual protein kinase regulating ubiquinone biosynthesis (AarF/ABC1/UbiB family)
MTVYVATLKDGTKHVIKVLNPNAEEFIRQNIDDARKILKFLKKKSYAFAEYLLQDLEEWLMDDINSEHKVGGSDDPFAKINPETDYITSSGESVTVSTPKITPTGTKYIMIEEYIEGRNLKEVLSDKNIDGSKYIEATEQSYQHQLESYSDDGKTKAHSDVHIGNVRLGNDGKLYWIDRGHYIESEK